MIKVGIIGASGYGGAELVRILYNHPGAQPVALSSVSFAGKELAEIYPAFMPDMGGFLRGLSLGDEDSVIAASDVIFAALPHGLSEDIAAKCVQAGKRFIDLGADFRLHDPAVYEQWYGKTYTHPALHENALYALPELNRADIQGRRIIANPGCYPTAAALGLYPALRAQLICSKGIIIDAKSGTTGAGRSLSQKTHFAECNEGFAPYAVGSHRHTPEIEQTLSELSGKAITLTFVPHLLPINRGILSTIYVERAPGATLSDLHAAYADAYQNEAFIRLYPPGSQPVNVRNVKYSNYADISLHEDARTGRFIIVSAIDNMVKGAAGQAVQNMNILCGLPETAGLTLVPPAF